MNNLKNYFWLKSFRTLGLILLILYIVFIVAILFGYDVFQLPNQAINILVPFGVLLSALIASYSVMVNIENTNENEKSEFTLENVVNGFDTVYNLLEDRNNNRIIWIEAARNLSILQKLKKQITKDEHRKILYIKEHEFRHKLSQVLFPRMTDDFKIDTKFFTGKPYWNMAAINSKIKTFREDMEEMDRDDSQENTALDPVSVKVVFDYLAFPNDYQDPLEVDLPDNFDIMNWKHQDINHRQAPAEYFEYLKEMETDKKN